MHLESVNDLLHIFKLLFAWSSSWLSQESTESQGFPDSGRRKVKILLLHISSLPLEPCISRSAVDEEFAVNNTNTGAIGQNIE